MSARSRLTEIIDRVLCDADVEAIARYAHPDITVYANGTLHDYATLESGLRRLDRSEVSFALDYDDDAWVATDDRVAGRIWIVVTRTGEEPVEKEIVLVATFVDGWIHRVWGLCWPDRAARPR